jgi:ABC-type nitrate/sulfonate/bicarbonate transport system permease component
MKISQELSTGKQRLVGATTVVLVVLVWFVLTLPVLPPLSARPVPTDADRKAAGQAHLGATDSAPSAGSQDPSPAGTPPASVDAPAAGSNAAPDDTTPGTTDLPSAQTPAGRRPIVPETILPSPVAVLLALAHLHTEEGLVRSAAMSFYRITVSFFFAALVAIPLGTLMGAYPPIRNAIEPFSGPLRYLPISAVTGLFILLFGIEERMKIAFLFTGTVVYLLPIVVECVQRVDDIYLETAYTLGARPWQIILHVLVPAAWPGIFEACRVIYGIGWTYVILAELINVDYGLGHLIEASYKRGHIDWAYALVLVILLLGVGTNELFVLTSRKLFAWREAA